MCAAGAGAGIERLAVFPLDGGAGSSSAGTAADIVSKGFASEDFAAGCWGVGTAGTSTSVGSGPITAAFTGAWISIEELGIGGVGIDDVNNVGIEAGEPETDGSEKPEIICGADAAGCAGWLPNAGDASPGCRDVSSTGPPCSGNGSPCSRIAPGENCASIKDAFSGLWVGVWRTATSPVLESGSPDRSFFVDELGRDAPFCAAPLSGCGSSKSARLSKTF